MLIKLGITVFSKIIIINKLKPYFNLYKYNINKITKCCYGY